MKKKIFRLIPIVVIALCALFVLSSCGGLELDDPKNITYDGTTIRWESVNNASGYTVSINGGKEWSVSNNYYSYNAKGEQFSVTVTAVSEAKKLVQSGSTTMDFQPLDKVENIQVSKDGVFTWDPVNFASGYKVKVDGVELDEPVYATQFSNVKAGTHSVQLMPIVQADPSYYAVWSDSVSVTVLGKVENIKYSPSDGRITWGYVSGAAKYEVRVNGTLLSDGVEATSIAYDSNNADFEVTVKALGTGNTCNGAVSDVKKFIYLETVTDLRVEDGVAVWSAIDRADGYKIKINGQILGETLTEAKYDKLFAGQSIDIQVMPVASDASYFSDWSSAKSVFLLTAPTLQWSDYELNGDANTNLFWDSIPNAVGYSVKVTYPNGRVETTTSSSVFFQEAYLEAGTYTVQVKAVAESASSNFYDSQYSLPLTVTRLKAPTATDRNFIQSNPDKLSDGFTVTFNGVNGASSYALYKDGSQVQNSVTNQFSVGNLVDNATMTQQTINFSIRAIGHVQRVQGGGIHATLSSLSSQSLNFEIKVLSTPTNLDISGYNLTYTTVDQSYGYSVSVAGSSYTSNSTSYDLSLLNAGNYEVKVCARGNGTNVLASNYTPAINIHRLEAPTNVKIATADTADGQITFDDVMYAQSYAIVYNNNGVAIPVSKQENIKQFITEQGTVVHLTAIANYFNTDKTIYYMSSQPSQSYTFIKLAAPTFGNAPFASGNQLVWNAPGNVDPRIYTPTYQVYNIDNEIEAETNGTAMDITELAGGKSYTFRIQAIGDGVQYINSDVSTQAATFYKIETPEIRREGGKYVWDSVLDADSYALYIDGKKVDEQFDYSGNSFSYTPYFEYTAKGYTVELIAKGDGITSVDSSKFVMEQKTKQLERPEFAFSYSHPEVSTSGEILLEITKESPYAKGYSYTIGGSTHESTELSYSLNPNTTGTFMTAVYALGGNFDDEGVYYTDSQLVGNNASYQIILLGAPDMSSVDVTSKGKLTWGLVASATAYEVTITTNFGTETVTVNEPMYAIADYSSVTTLTVSIKAIGNGVNTITSVSSTPKIVK